MASVDKLRVLGAVSRRDLEQAALELRGARDEFDRTELAVQVARQRLHQERTRADAVHAEEAGRVSEGRASAGDVVDASAFRAHLRQRLEMLASRLEAAEERLEGIRRREAEARKRLRRILERCDGIDEKLQRQVAAELSRREDRADEEGAEARVGATRRSG
jgi:hypothetical protein